MPHRPEAGKESSDTNKKVKGYTMFVGIAIIIFGIIMAIIWKAGNHQRGEETKYRPPTNPAPYPQAYEKKETRRFEYASPSGDGTTLVKLETNCDKEDFIAIIPPRHQIKIHHVYFDETVKANRCSYNVYGDSYPVMGPDEAYHKTLAEFKNDLPAPQFIAHKSLIKFVGAGTEYRDFKHNGEEIVFDNCSGEDIRVYSIYNISKGILFSGLAQQIGHDGSTVTFEGVITPAQCR